MIIHKSVTSIASNAFSGCYLIVRIEVDENNTDAVYVLWVNYVKNNAEELIKKHSDYIFNFYEDNAKEAFEKWAYKDFNENLVATEEKTSFFFTVL